MALKIGVFDSGVGGLTVLRALLERIPEAEFVYLGDTARLPYGSKSRATIARYAAGSAEFLLEQGAQFLVIACNTASALALPEIRAVAAGYDVPVLGVVETGARAADAASVTRDVLVMATAATVESGAYGTACAAHGLRVREMACPLLVPLVEEGWIDHPVTEEVVDIYVNALLRGAAEAQLSPDTLVLGCTHYPLIREVIQRAVPVAVRVIDSAEVTAEQARGLLVEMGLVTGAHEEEKQVPPLGSASVGMTGLGSASAGMTTPGRKAKRVRFFATDSVEKFKVLGERFLGRAMERVELVDLGG